MQKYIKKYVQKFIESENGWLVLLKIVTVLSVLQICLSYFYYPENRDVVAELFGGGILTGGMGLLFSSAWIYLKKFSNGKK